MGYLERLIRGCILSHIDAIRERCCVRLENEAAITDLGQSDVARNKLKEKKN